MKNVIVLAVGLVLLFLSSPTMAENWVWIGDFFVNGEKINVWRGSSGDKVSEDSDGNSKTYGRNFSYSDIRRAEGGTESNREPDYADGGNSGNSDDGGGGLDAEDRGRRNYQYRDVEQDGEYPNPRYPNRDRDWGGVAVQPIGADEVHQNAYADKPAAFIGKLETEESSCCAEICGCPNSTLPPELDDDWHSDRDLEREREIMTPERESEIDGGPPPKSCFCACAPRDCAD